MTARFFTVLCTLLPAALAAQQPSDTVELKPVVVTATRLPTPADAVTAAVTVLGGAELRAHGVRTVFDALRAVPGAAVFQIGSFGGITSLFLRGGQSDYVKVLVDGVPVNQPGGAFDFAHLTTDNVDRIEVLQGPASVVYGSDAVTGVVQVITRRGSSAGPARADASLRGGTHGTLVWDANASGGGAAGGYAFSVSRFTSDGVYAFNNGYRNTVVSALVHAAPDDRTDATLSLRYGDQAYHFPTDGAGNPVDRNQFTYGSGPTLGLDVGHFLTPRLELRALVTTNETDGGFDDRSDDASDTTGFNYGFQSLDHIRRTGADLRANYHGEHGTVVTGGASLELESQRSFNQSQGQFGNSAGQIDERRRNAAYYAQVVTDLGAPTRRIALDAGLRLEDNERFGTFATYRFGAAYRPAGGTRVRFSTGRGFREPTFFESFASGFAFGNPALRPERSWSWEVGVEQRLPDGRASATATWFDQRFRDLIDYNPAPAPPDTVNYFNVAGARAQGLELGARLVPVASLSVSASYTYLRTEVTASGFDASSGAAFASGQPLLRRPRHALRLDADWRWTGRGAASVSVNYVGARADQDFTTFPFQRVTLRGYTRVDIGGTVEVIRPRGHGPGFEASVRVENLLDARYEEVLGFPARRRVILGGGRVQLGG